MNWWKQRKARRVADIAARLYKAYGEAYPFLWPLIDRFNCETPEKFVVTPDQYYVLLGEPEFVTSGYRTGKPSSYEFNYDYVCGETKWVAKTRLGVPIYVEVQDEQGCVDESSGI